MSRDDVKSFRNALIVMSGLAALAPAAIVGWKASSAISEIKGNANVAVQQVAESVREVRSEIAQHRTWDRTWSRQATAAINQCCHGVALAAPGEEMVQ